MKKHLFSDLFSGGGSHGAAGAALAKKHYRPETTLYIGWSTGALIAVLVALNKLDLLREIYCSVSQKDIFNVNPFTKKGGINIFNAFLRTISFKSTLGETKNLKKLIDKYLSQEMFEELQNSNKEVVVATSSLKSKGLKVEYFSSDSCDYETFKMAMWASASPPLVGSIVEIDGNQYTDAGAIELLNFEYAIGRNVKDMNAIIHRTEFSNKEYVSKVNRWWDFLGRLIPGIMNENIVDDIIKGSNNAKLKGCNVNLIFMPIKPDFTTMVFDKSKMTKLYNDTLNY